MTTGEIVEKIHTLLESNLVMSSPVLSGNMQSYIKTDISGGYMYSRDIVIDAPFYDPRIWEKKGVIVHTGDVIYGRTAYAEWVNRLGAFGRPNKSQGWVDRSIKEVVTAIANEVGAQVIYDI